MNTELMEALNILEQEKISVRKRCSKRLNSHCSSL